MPLQSQPPGFLGRQRAPGLALVLAGACLCVQAQAQAQTDSGYLVTLLVPFAPGSEADRLAQQLSRLAQKQWPQTRVAIVYQSGESGTLAARQLSRAPADGYTLMLGRTTNLSLAPTLDPQAGYGWKDFSYIAVLEQRPLICAVPLQSPYRHARELLSAIRSAPGKLKYATSGPVSVQALAGLLLLKLAGLRPDSVRTVHFDGSGQVAQALQDGQVDFACSTAPTLIKAAQAGQISPLFVTSVARLAELPQLKTASEVGLRDMGRISSWAALVGPRGLPQEHIQRWRQLLQQWPDPPSGPLPPTEPARTEATRPSAQAPEEFVRKQVELFEELAVLTRMSH